MKIIKDTVHGYIDVPKDYFDKFIDTEIFQRLRHIEQTSMRGLYPCARHDRFSHSLGVFHLGKIAISNLKKECKDIFNDNFTSDELSSLSKSFEIACLLHDCGHAPFSHTCELYYKQQTLLEDELTSLLDTEPFKDDFTDCFPAAHEMVSSIVVLREFSEEIEAVGAKAELVVRMILGCQYQNPARGEKEHIINSIISVLNGSGFDVDKLDYATRDTWASGIRNVSVDTPRILKALRLGRLEGRYELCFHKSSISVVKSLIMAVDYLYKWIYSHHKVVYEVSLLRRSVELLMQDLDPENGVRDFFSTRAFFDPIEVGGESVYRPTDGDVRYLLKKRNITLATELCSRNYQYFPLWKTYPEYNILFSGIDDKDKIREKIVSNQVIEAFLSAPESHKCLTDTETVRHGSKPVSPNRLKFLYKDTIRTYKELFPEEALPAGDKYWHLFIHKDYESRSDEIKEFVRSLRS